MGVGHMLFLARRFDAAIDQEVRTLEMDEQFSMAHWILGLTYEQIGRIEESVESIARADRYSGGNPLIRGLHGRACALAGRTEAAHALLHDRLAGDASGYVAPDAVAFIHAGLRQTDAAFEWFDRAVDHGCFSMAFAAVSPVFDSLRDDPRFVRLLRRLRLA
jgi:tetratricopeptide (TPR) repeat protein